MKLFLGIVGTIVVSVVAAEFSVLAPWFAERLLRSATRILPPAQRSRYVAEWLGELDAVPGQVVKLLFAVRVALRAPATRRGLQGLDPLWVALVRRLLVALVTAALTVARIGSRVLARIPIKRPALAGVVLVGDPDQPAPSILGAELDTPIEELDLAPRTYSSLKRGGVITIGNLVTRSEGDLLNIRNFGARHVDEVREKLHELGLSLREE
jgi:hypothetical protein